MAYFHCLIGGGSSGGGYELTVTCDADFAGTTITCTDGVTTLTQTCPSSSPYEVVFEIPNGGDWTISGVVSGQTITTGVNIPTSATLEAIVQKTITIYSAKEDTITYTDIYGDTQTEVFASGQSSKQITIDVEASGSSITFTSSVAKNPNNLSQDYSKTFTITTSTTDIYLMPDPVKTLYWWGYNNGIESFLTTNGWSSTVILSAPTFNTNNIVTVLNQWSGCGSSSSISNANKIYAIGLANSGTFNQFRLMSAKDLSSESTKLSTSFTSSLSTVYQDSSSYSNFYIGVLSNNSSQSTVYALWYD